MSVMRKERDGLVALLMTTGHFDINVYSEDRRELY